METHSFLYAVVSIFGLLAFSTLVHFFCKKIKIPFAVGLLLGGMLIGFFVQNIDNWFVISGVTSENILKYLDFSPEMVLYVFLPTLIFEAAYHLKFRQFKNVLLEVSLLSTFGLLISILFISIGLYYTLAALSIHTGLSFAVLLLFAALISATDPVAVLAVFKDLKAPKYLATIVDGESLLNDGTALVIFKFFMTIGVGFFITSASNLHENTQNLSKNIKQVLLETEHLENELKNNTLPHQTLLEIRKDLKEIDQYSNSIENNTEKLIKEANNTKYIDKEFSFSSILNESGNFLRVVVFGILLGILFGWFFSVVISKSESIGVKLTLSLILAHTTFLVAEGFFHVSGILATLAAGLIVGNYGKRKLTSETKKLFSNVWIFLGFISNALIFLLLGVQLSNINLLDYWQLILITCIIVIFIARPVSVFIIFFITNLFRKKENRIPISYQIVTAWGGLRGALAATAVLLIPSSFLFAEELKAMTAGVIMGTFLINAMTLPYLLKKLNLLKFSNSEKIQRVEAQSLVDEKICEYLVTMLNRKYITQEIFEILKKRYLKKKRIANKELDILRKQISNSNRETEKILTNYALNIELKTYNKLFEIKEISEKRFVVLKNSIYRQLDSLEQNILPSERDTPAKVAPKIPATPVFIDKIKNNFIRKFILDIFIKYLQKQIYRRLRHYRARKIASWKTFIIFKYLKNNHEIFKDSEVVDKIIDRYLFWNKNAEQKTEELERQYPDFVLQVRLQMADNSCLEKEKKVEQEFFEEGFISKKVLDDLDQMIHKQVAINLHVPINFFIKK